jgi:hypothetical protein
MDVAMNCPSLQKSGAQNSLKTFLSKKAIFGIANALPRLTAA